MNKQLLDDLGFFLAHSAHLERAAAERLYELASMMKAHNNDELHSLFLALARFSVDHVNEVEAICRQHSLPDLKPWDYQWPPANAPETIPCDQVNHLMTPREALSVVIKVEQSAEAFYRSVWLQSCHERIRDYAEEFAAEEHQHAVAARRMLSRLDAAEESDRAGDAEPPAKS
ncbi:MAG: ferritin family protein [Ketobacteraceae bacterium]|nr:ferritin family protein [Ketobacteraceae bacterium]